MSNEISNNSIPNFCGTRRGSTIDNNIVTISPCSSVDINQCQNVISDGMSPTNPEKNIEIVLLKIREQLQSLGGRSILKLYTMLNLERLLRETSNTETSSRNLINDNGDNQEDNNNNSTNMMSSNNNSGSSTNNKVITLEASRTANSSFVGVVSSCASSLGISQIQNKTNSGNSKVFNNNDIFPEGQPMRRGSMVTPPKVNNDFNSYYKINERRYSRPRTNSLCIDSLHINSKVVLSNNSQLESTKSIEVCPLNDKEIRSSKLLDDHSTINSNTNGSPTSPRNDLYNDNISVTYDELVDGCVRVGLVLTTQVSILNK